MSELFIIGLGGHARVIAGIALACRLPVRGFLDGIDPAPPAGVTAPRSS